MDNSKNKLLYEKCKKIVKQWEFDFTASKGRVPSKLDIRDAVQNVRDAYRTYFKLKTADLMDVIDFENEPDDKNESFDTHPVPENEKETVPEITKEDNTWGTHLNKNIEPEVKKEVKQSQKVLSSFTKKLYNNSKFTKRNPRSRSSLNISKINSSQLESSISESFSQPCTSSENSNIENELPSINCTMPVMSDDKISFSQPISLTEQVLCNRYSLPSRQIDKGWLQRLSINTGTSTTDENMKITSENSLMSSYINNTDNSFIKDVISDSDDDEASKLHINKKRRLLSSYKPPMLSKPISEISLKFNTSETPVFKSEEPIENLQVCEKLNLEKNEPSVLINNIKDNIDIKETDKEFKETKTKIGTKKLDSENSDEDEEYKPKKQTRKGKKVTKKVEQKTENSDGSEDDSKQKTQTKKRKRIVKTKEKPKATRRTRGATKTEKVDDIPEDQETDEYILEYSVKPPPKTVPRIKKLPKQIIPDSDIPKSEPTDPETKLSQREAKLEKKIKSGTLNDNFIRLDMKKKIFVKGKKNMNFSKYKKNQWKNKKKALYGPDMDMGGCDGGSLTCFNCGKTGHFARQCKQPTDKLLPLVAAEEEICPIPSLAEASEMAKSSSLAVFKPNRGSKLDENDEETENIDQEENIIEQDDNVSKDDNNEIDEFEYDEDIEKYMTEVDISSIKALQPPKLNPELICEEKHVKPVYELNPDGSLPDTPKEVFKTLSDFGHKSFRPGQEKAVMRILCGKSTLVTLSTGSGKSLCYQLPALLYARHFNCISLVVSPLVSLMDDQVSSAESFLGVACLHASQTKPQREKVLKKLEEGLIKMLLLSPEAITAGEKASGFGGILRKLPPIAFACIDEAHCISQWSHNFRPSYLMICHVLRQHLGIKTILGLTATATHATCNSIVHHLQIPDGVEGIISDVPIPENLHLNVSSDQNRDVALRELLGTSPYSEFNSIIIYCTRREECERIASFLRTALRPIGKPTQKYKSLSPIAEPYHAGLAASRRRTVQKAFMDGHLNVVVATVAFGMGINKSDIRAVIHYNMPSSFESYVQEVGRSGRDGLLAKCHVFINKEDKDLYELKRHIYANSLDRYSIRKLLQKIFIPCNCSSVCPKHEVAFSIQETVQDLDIPEENISTLLCYLELHENKYVEVLTPAYVSCKIVTYGGRGEIRKAMKGCAPLAMALALHPPSGKDDNEQVYEFPVVDVAAAMGWDSGIVKHTLKNLEWVTENNQPKRSRLSVQFSNLGFRLRAPGNLPSNELDETLDTLYNKVTTQLDTSLKQLHALHSALTSVSARSHRVCLDEQGQKLRKEIREYFSSENPLKDVLITSKKDACEEQISADVRQLVYMYRDNKFNGRAVARIFHGIQSPRYPAVIWGKCRFWRQHLEVDFNILYQVATKEIHKML